MRSAIGIIRLALIAVVMMPFSPAGAVDPWDKATDDYPGTLFRIWRIATPIASGFPTMMVYSVRNATEQPMNYRVECTLNNSRLALQAIDARWIDNIKPDQRGFGKAILRGFVDAPPNGLHCRVSDSKPTPEPIVKDAAAIRVTQVSYNGLDLQVRFQLTNSAPSTMSYQIECMIAAQQGVKDVEVRWVEDVPSSSIVEGLLEFSRGNELATTGWSCRIADAMAGHPGH